MNFIPTAYAASVDLKDAYGFGNYDSLASVMGALVGPGFAIAALAVIIYFLIGAFRFVLSGGDKNAVSGARNMIIHAIIGFILLMLMFLIIQFVPEFLGLKGFEVIKTNP